MYIYIYVCMYVCMYVYRGTTPTPAVPSARRVSSTPTRTPPAQASANPATRLALPLQHTRSQVSRRFFFILFFNFLCICIFCKKYAYLKKYVKIFFFCSQNKFKEAVGGVGACLRVRACARVCA